MTSEVKWQLENPNPAIDLRGKTVGNAARMAKNGMLG